MWFWCLFFVNIFILLYLPSLYIPCWIHLPCVTIFFLYNPAESTRFRSLSIWKYLLPYDIINPENVLDKNEQCIYAVHPHGLYCTTIHRMFALNKDMLHVKAVASSAMFWLLPLKQFTYLSGSIPANRKDIINILNGGNSIVLSPGGLREMLGLDLKRVADGNGFVQRNGFIKLAHLFGIPVVPIYAKDENPLFNIYHWSPYIERILLSLFYYPGIIFSWGNPFVKTRIVVGKKIMPDVLTQKKFYEEMNFLKKYK